ncbi:MAG: hypothetical protein FJX72_12040 [Armatimonadetes bacterium]|nr:hypothetical protein [Armatimonadota bacterium]
MKPSVTPDFRDAFARIPPDVRARARLVYRLWLRDPRHPSLRFEKVGSSWAVRIGGGYRALAVLKGDHYYWYWIGKHDEYETFLQGA